MMGCFSLEGQVAGGGRGIGKGMALAFADCGADVVVTARWQEDVDAVAKEIEERGGVCAASIFLPK